MTLRTWEHDDYPIDKDRFLREMDRLKATYPKFCVTVFAIPAMMNRRHWRDLRVRRRWIRVGVHGFTHKKRECRFKEIWSKHLGLLDEVTEDDRWLRLFKPPWYGWSNGFLTEATDREFELCTKALYGFPSPMPAGWKHWNIASVLAAHYSNVQHEIDYGSGKGIRDEGLHVVSHPVYPPGSLAKRKAGQTEISARHFKHWERHWSPDDEWAFVNDLTTPALLKLNLGCGPDVRDGWACLDPRAKDLGPRVIEWDFSRMLPYGDNKADLVLTSHCLGYVPEEKYVEAALEIWRVLRPDGIWRLQDDCTDSGYIWRKLGQTNTFGQGEIMSEPTNGKLFAMLKAVGFEIHGAGPGETLSPHKDVLEFDSRSRRHRLGHKFYAEAVKRVVPGFDISRPRWHDFRAQKRGRYLLPDLAIMHANEPNREGTQ